MKALDILLQGNKRFVSGRAIHPNQGLDRLKAVATKQEPIAVILSCSDSRVSPEIIFDQGLGDIFVVRCAGAVAGRMELASIEYAVNHLRVSLLLVLGHKRCGALAACFTEHTDEKMFYLPELIAGIKDKIGPVGSPAGEEALDQAVRKNSKATIEVIAREEFIKQAVAGSGLALAAGYYDLDSGIVSII